MLRPVVITGISLMCGCADSCSKQEPSNSANDGEQGSQGGEQGSQGGEQGSQGGKQGSQGGEQGSQGGAGAGLTDPVVAQRLEAYRAKTGPITVTLIWDTKDDLDLSVVTPSKEVINWEEKFSTCGGVLQIDANSNNSTTKPIEHIYWEAGKIKAGQYIVRVSLDKAPARAVPFKVLVKNGLGNESYGGTITAGKNASSVVAVFKVDNPGAFNK